MARYLLETHWFEIVRNSSIAQYTLAHVQIHTFDRKNRNQLDYLACDTTHLAGSTVQNAELRMAEIA